MDKSLVPRIHLRLMGFSSICVHFQNSLVNCGSRYNTVTMILPVPLLISLLAIVEFSLSVTEQSTPFHNANRPSSQNQEKAHSKPSNHRSARTAVSKHETGDPCGPQGSQTDLESTLYTCGQINTTYTHAPSRYGVQCLSANPNWKQSINITSCATNIENLCDAMVAGRLVESQWNWSSGVKHTS